MSFKNTSKIAISSMLGIILTCSLFLYLLIIFPSTLGPREKSYAQEIKNCKDIDTLNGILNRLLNFSESSYKSSEFMIRITSASILILIILFGLNLIFTVRIRKEILILEIQQDKIKRE